MAKTKIDLASRIALVGVSLLLVLFGFQWYLSSSNLSDYKLEKEKELASILKLKEKNLIGIDSLKINDSTTVVRIDDIQQINERYDDLFTYVENNTNRAESLIDKDLDRLNLYLAIGIGFVGILGIFVPILVNIMSVQDLRDKMRSMPDVEMVNKAAEDARLALEASENISGLKEKIDEMTEYYQKTGPAITSLILQNAIGRFFNISPRLITKLKREKDRKYFIKLLETIKNGFEHCKNDGNHNVSDNPFLKETIIDFRIHISDQTFQSSVFTEAIVRKFVVLSGELGKLIESSNRDQENEAIDGLNIIFSDLIADLNLI